MLVKYDFFSFEAKLFGMSRCDGFEPARNMACIQHKPINTWCNKTSPGPFLISRAVILGFSSFRVLICSKSG